MEKVKKTLNICENVMLTFFSLLCTFGLTTDPSKNDALSFSFNTNIYLAIFLVVMIFVILKYTLRIREKRLIVCSLIIAIIFACFEVIGHSLNRTFDLAEILYNRISIVQLLLRIISFTIIGYCLISNLYLIISEKVKANINNSNEMANRKNNQLSHTAIFFICFILIFMCYVPYFLQNYPGVLTPDSLYQIAQVIGEKELTNHHPIFHTFIIFLCMKVGEIFGNYNIGVAFYSILQMIFLSAIFSYLISYMVKRNINKIIIILSLLFFALYPINAMYSFTMWKDIPFACSMILLTICIWNMCIKKELFWKSKKNVLFFIISMLLVMMLRNNGVYIAILFMPILLLFERKNLKRIVTACLIIICIFSGFKIMTTKIFHVSKSESVEALSIPLQQIARIERDNYHELTKEDQMNIEKYIISVENIAKEYNPTLSDPVKTELTEENFQEDKIGFFLLYFKLAFKFPKTTILSFLCQNFGYWYPEINNWKIAKGISSYLQIPEKLNIYEKPIINSKIIDMLIDSAMKDKIPVISLIYSIGFAFWCILICMGYVIYKKEYRLLLIYIPLLLLWLTSIASPVYGEYRYVYSMFVCIPLLIGNVSLIGKEE